MKAGDVSAAAATIEALGASAANLGLAAYWLSLWFDGLPPDRAAFDPARVKHLLPGVAVIQVFGDGVAVCRIAGTAIEAALGKCLTGCELVSLVPRELRRVRQIRHEALVDGGIALSKNYFCDEFGNTKAEERIYLPFSGVAEDGSRQFLFHTTLRPGSHNFLARPEKWHAGIPDEYTALPLC